MEHDAGAAEPAQTEGDMHSEHDHAVREHNLHGSDGEDLAAALGTLAAVAASVCAAGLAIAFLVLRT